MKTINKISLTLLFLVFTTILNAQNYDVPEGFKWTDKDEYLYHYHRIRNMRFKSACRHSVCTGTIDIDNDQDIHELKHPNLLDHS